MKMKKLLATVLAVASVATVCSMAACKDKNVKYVAKEIVMEGEPETYGLTIGKTSSKKTEILTAMNKVIADISLDMQDIVNYFDAIASEQTPSTTLDFPNLDDNTAGNLNVYTNAEFAPFEFVDDDQNIVGVDMYIMQLVAEELNMKVTFHDIDFDAIVGKVRSEDNAIGAAGMTITDERKEAVDFSNPYFSTIQCIISKEEGEAFTKLEELKGKTIGVQKGTTGAFLIEEAIESGVLKDTGAKLVEYLSGPLAYTALKSGQCDVVVIDKLPANQLVK